MASTLSPHNQGYDKDLHALSLRDQCENFSAGISRNVIPGSEISALGQDKCIPGSQISAFDQVPKQWDCPHLNSHWHHMMVLYSLQPCRDLASPSCLIFVKLDGYSVIIHHSFYFISLIKQVPGFLHLLTILGFLSYELTIHTF